MYFSTIMKRPWHSFAVFSQIAQSWLVARPESKQKTKERHGTSLTAPFCVLPIWSLVACRALRPVVRVRLKVPRPFATTSKRRGALTSEDREGGRFSFLFNPKTTVHLVTLYLIKNRHCYITRWKEGIHLDDATEKEVVWISILSDTGRKKRPIITTFWKNASWILVEPLMSGMKSKERKRRRMIIVQRGEERMIHYTQSRQSKWYSNTYEYIIHIYRRREMQKKAAPYFTRQHRSKASSAVQ